MVNVFSVFKTFLKLGLTSFGGPVAHIGYFRKELVEKQAWVSEQQFSQLLALCQFLPGPASSQLGFALGLHRAGWLGAIAAFIAFTLPSALMLIAFASLLPLFSGDIMQGAIHGLKLVACVIVADAVLGMWKNLCPDIERKVIAVLSVILLLSLQIPFAQMLIILLGAIFGVIACSKVSPNNANNLIIHYSKNIGIITGIIFVALLIALPILSDGKNLFALADIFYQAGAMVFGGGHVVLPLLENSLVDGQWISAEDFLAGYGASQAIPGPMFAFASYLGASIPSESSAVLLALTALLFIFLPGFLLLIAALPLWQNISANQTAAKAVAGINAAVVGVLAAAFYDPILTSGLMAHLSSGSENAYMLFALDAAIVLIGFALLRAWKLSPLYIVLWCVASSAVVSFI